jgi:hypothetical protein
MKQALMSIVFLLAAVLRTPAIADEKLDVTLYKTPQCGCCENYADYMRDNGFDVTVVASHDLSLIKSRHGVPEEFEGCHTMLIDGYVVEGHVPLETIARLLEERPDITGISLPGMPQGSPGMSGRKTEPFTIHEFGGDQTKVYAVE